MGNLAGKVALVTGAASRLGIGHAVALRLARDGADIVVVDRYLIPPVLLDEDKRVGWKGLLGVVEEIEAMGRKSMAIKADISRSQEVKEMVKEALARFGKIDILINNAGIVDRNMSLVRNMDEAEWNRVIGTDLTGQFLVSREIIPSMISRGEGGRIINVSSRSGKSGYSNSAAYCSAKFGLIGLTQCLAIECAPYKINVNAVCPGGIASGIRNEWALNESKRLGIPPEEVKARYYEERKKRVPLGRVGLPEDIAGAIAFLASSDSDWITGEALNINGGELMD